MTIFPETPDMVTAPPKDGREMRRLADDNTTFVPFWFGWSLQVTVKAGYETDGATVSISDAVLVDEDTKKKINNLVKKYFPGEAIESVYKRIVGTPWDMPRLFAAIVHDALYSIKWCSRFMCDRAYKHILKQTNYEKVRREIEYDAIRLVGWRNWNAVSQEEQDTCKDLVIVKWVKTKKVPKIIEELNRTTNKRRRR